VTTTLRLLSGERRRHGGDVGDSESDGTSRNMAAAMAAKKVMRHREHGGDMVATGVTW